MQSAPPFICSRTALRASHGESHGAPNRPAVAAGHAEHRAGRAHSRTWDPPFLDRVAHVRRDRIRAADVANRRDAGLYRLARVLDGAQHSLIRRRRLYHAHHVRFAAALEMGMRVDETRRHARRFEVAGTTRDTNFRDATVVEHDIDATFGRLERTVIEDPGSNDHRGLLSNPAHAVPLMGRNRGHYVVQCSCARAAFARAIASSPTGPSTSMVKCPILRRATAWRLP